MGEAIARFREAALAIRRLCDEAVIYPGHLFLLTIANPLQAAAVGERLKAGRMSAAQFARLLRQSGGVAGVPDVAGLGLFDDERKKILSQGPQRREFDSLHSLALSAAASRPDLLPVIEKRLCDLKVATIALRELASDSSSSRYVQHKQRYASELERWHEAYEALAPTIEESPAAAGSTKQKKTGGRKKKGGKGPGGTPEKRSLDFYADAVEWCEKEQKKARKTKQRQKTIAQLLSDYFTNEKKMPLSEAIPPQHPGEPWDERATRFWDTAKQRIKRAN